MDISKKRYIRDKINLSINNNKKDIKKIKNLQRFMNRRLSLSMILEISDANFTKDAFLYQDIISYYFVIVLKDSNGKFSFRELAKWLMKKNLENY